MANVTIKEGTALIKSALLRSNTSDENAGSVAKALIEAELAGQGGHGFRRVEAYCAQAASGKVQGQVAPELTQTRPGAISINAKNGFAYPALDLAMSTLPEITRKQGIAICGIHHSHHCGVAGVIVEAYANLGLVALMVANAPASMAPWGGRKALFGTDPIAFAAPIQDAHPVVVDISLSKVARGKIMAANQTGDPIPEGWALDPEGNPTTDAGKALVGTMVPAGDAKGVALAIMVEMLCAGLIGANYAYEASSFFDAEGTPPGVGQTIIAIDPAGLSDMAVSRFTELAGEIETMEGTRLPGRRRQQIKADLTANGIPIPDDLLARISAIGS